MKIQHELQAIADTVAPQEFVSSKVSITWTQFSKFESHFSITAVMNKCLY